MKALARGERARLLKALEEFVKTGDTAADLRHFEKRWPGFFPDLFFMAAMDYAEHPTQSNRAGEMVHSFKTKLRDLWKGGKRVSGSGLTEMLAIEPPPDFLYTDEHSLGDVLEFYSEATISVDWESGEFRYKSNCEFHRALYLLVKESWRARVCAYCSSYFIAKKPHQRYCSTDCSDAVQTKLKRKWWRQHGNAWRKRRARKPQRKRGK
jgi:hypothetical protein